MQTQTQAQTPAQTRLISEKPRIGLVLFVVGAGTLLTSMSGSMANLALPSLGRDLGISIESSRWVAQSFLLVLAVLLLPAGRLSDQIGHARVYLFGFLMFGAMSLLCGYASNFETLIAGRVLQAVGGSMAIASGPALLTTNSDSAKRGRALGILATATYLGLTIGPPLGGLFISSIGWRWTFYFNAPVSVLVVALGVVCLPGVWRRPHASGPHRPLLDMGLFKSRMFTGAVLSAVANYIALFSLTLLMPFCLEEGMGLDPSSVGLLLSVQPLAMTVVASPSGWLSDRIGTRGLAMAGMLIMACGVLGVSTLSQSSGSLDVVCWMAVIGLGTGIFISPNSSALMGSAPGQRQGMAAGILAEARIVGMFLGIAVAAAIFKAFGGKTGVSWGAGEFVAFEAAVRVAAGAALLGAIAAALGGGKVSND